MPMHKHLLALTKATAAAIPHAGGPLASLLGDYLPTECQRRIETWLGNLDRRLKSVEIDQERFGFLLQTAAPIVGREHREFKRAMLANILCDATKPSDEDLSLWRLFIDITNHIEPYHIAVLRCIRTCSVEGVHRADVRPHSRYYAHMTDIRRAVRDAGAGSTDADALTVPAVAYLLDAGLIFAREFSDGVPKQIRTHQLTISRMIDISHYTITKLGGRYAEYLEDALTE